MRASQETLDACIALMSLLYYCGAVIWPFKRPQRSRNLTPFLFLLSALLLIWTIELAVTIYQKRGILDSSTVVVSFSHMFIILFQSHSLWSSYIYKEESGPPCWDALAGSWIFMVLVNTASFLHGFQSHETNIPRLSSSGLRFLLVLGLFIALLLPDGRGRIRLAEEDVEQGTASIEGCAMTEDFLDLSVASQIRSLGGYWPWVKSFYIFKEWIWSREYLFQTIIAALLYALGGGLAVITPSLHGRLLASIGHLDADPVAFWPPLLRIMMTRVLSVTVMSTQSLCWEALELSRRKRTDARMHEYIMHQCAPFHEGVPPQHKALARSWAGDLIKLFDSVLLDAPFALITVIATASTMFSSFGLLVFLAQLWALTVKRIFTSLGEQWSRHLRDEINMAYQESSGHLLNGQRDWRPIKIYGQEKQNILDYQISNARMRMALWRDKLSQNVLRFPEELVTTLTTYAIMLIIIWSTDTAKTTRAIASFEGYSALLDANLSKLLKLPDEVLSKLLDADRLRRLVAYPHNMTFGTEELDMTKGLIEFKNITFGYSGPKNKIFQGFDLTCEPGKTTAIVGGSGIGKTTLFDLILRMRDPDEGDVQIDGQDLRSLRKERLSQNIAYIAQRPSIFPGTFMKNIKYAAPHSTDEAAHDAAKTVGIHDHIVSQANGYQTTISDDSPKLSGGEKQRLMIARALLQKRNVLLLDEITSSLDSKSEKMIQHAIEQNYAGATVVITAHRSSMIKKADRIIFLGRDPADGLTKIVESGTHAELIAKRGKYWKELVD